MGYLWLDYVILTDWIRPTTFIGDYIPVHLSTDDLSGLLKNRLFAYAHSYAIGTNPFIDLLKNNFFFFSTLTITS